MIESVVRFNGFEWNRHDVRDSNLTMAPHYWAHLVSVDGIWDDEVRFEKYDYPQRNASRSGDVFTTGKTLVMAGVLYGLNFGYMRLGQMDLRQAFYDAKRHRLNFSLFDGVGEDGMPTKSDVYITCRKNQRIDMPEEQADTTYSRRFTVQVFADDPRMYAQEDESVYEAFVTGL